MNIRATDFFSKAEKEQIKRSVKAAETHTTGEIAVMLVDESDRYREAETMGAGALACLVSTVISLILDYAVASSWSLVPDPHYTTIWFWIPVAVILLAPAWYLFRLFPHLKLVLLSRKRVETAVRERALLSFFQKGLHRTKNETGILVFISLLERRVRIMGDRGIHARIGQAFWNARANELVKGIREGKALEVLVEVIEKCGSELRNHFPCGADNPDELPDDVIC
jgi:putative membrane protein